MQVCGLGWVKAQADGSIDPKVLGSASRINDARARLVATLRSSKSELARATGLWLSKIDAGAGIDETRDALARSVVSSTDPKAYALAFNVCRSNKRNEGACQLLSASQWARLDPGNATPWMTLLSEAKARKDRAAEEDALHQIATAQRSDLGFFATVGVALSAAPDDDASVLAAWGTAVELIGMAAAWSMPSYQHVMVACKGAALNDSNRRQTCSAIAQVLTERSNSFIEQSVGGSIGKHLGLPAERREWQSAEYSAYLAAQGASSTGHQSLACADLRRGLEGFRRAAAVGEIGALREWVAHSGKKHEDFVREANAREAQWAMEYARLQAASAPAVTDKKTDTETDTNKDASADTKAAPEPRLSSGTAPP